MNKTDLISPESLAKIKTIIRSLNSTTKIYPTNKSNIELDKIMNTRLFDLDIAQKSQLWQKELQNEHKSEKEIYGISNFVYKARFPFNSKKLKKLLTSDTLAGVIRAKGLYWISTDMDRVYEYSQAGINITIGNSIGTWWVCADSEFWPVSQIDIDKIEANFDGKYGARRQEIVFVGVDINPEVITNELNKCLVIEKELEALKYKNA